MSKWAAMAGSNGAMIASAVAVAIAAVVAAFYLNTRTAPDAVAVVQPDVTAAQETALPEPASPTPENAAEAPDVPPSIDEVRVEADGLTIVAGRAMPGSRVAVMLDGVENTAVTADSGGGFAAITTIMPKPTAQILTIVQVMEGQSLASAEEIILAPSTPALAEAVPTVPADPGTPATAAQVEPTVTASSEPAAPTPAATEVAEAPAAVETSASEPSTEPPTLGEEQVASLPSAPAGEEVAADPSTPVEEQVAAEPSAPVEEQVTGETSALVDEQVAVIEGSAAEPTVSAPRSTRDTTSSAVEPTASSDAIAGTETADAPAAAVQATETPAPTEAQTQQITVLKSTADGVEVLGPAPEALVSIAIDTISYSNEGNVQLSGRAQSNSDAVRVYVDNRPVTDLPVDEQGRWRGDLPDIDTGIYTLRVDEIDPKGDVTSRVETPFRREDPQVLAAADDPARVATQITVQTGATLWAIARDRYGKGRLYVQVFEANRDSIQDPDLIYPGQVFALPD